MSRRSIMVLSALLVLGASAQAAEQSRQTTVMQDMAPQGPIPVPYPNITEKSGAGGSPAGASYAGSHVLYQDVTIPQSVKDGTSNTLMVGERLPGTSLPPGPSPGGTLGSLKSLQGTQALFQSSRGGEQGAHHTGGVNVALADGSVRLSEDGTGGEGGPDLANPTGGGTKLPAVQKVREAVTRVDEQRAGNGSPQGVSVNLQRLANPSLPSAGGGPQVKVFDGGSGAQAATQGRGVFILSTDRAVSTGAKIK